MKLAGAFHTPDFLKLMNRAIDEARADLRASGRDDGSDAQRVIMVLRLVASVSAGERNLGRLKSRRSKPPTLARAREEALNRKIRQYCVSMIERLPKARHVECHPHA
jgi:hypothetical protein